MTRLSKVVSLFSGAGGLDIGLENAGFDVTLCLDNDPVAVATLKHNQSRSIPRPDGQPYLNGTKILQADLTTIALGELREELCHDEIDLLVGGPPCQPFSSAGGMRSFQDPRGTLYRHFVRVAADLRPHYVLFENVRGLATARGHAGPPGSALKEILEEFESIGYFTNVALLNAADYGAHQRRVRLFVLMCYGATPPNFPAATHYDSRKATSQAALWLFDEIGTLRPWRTLGEFLITSQPPLPDEVVKPTRRLAEMLRNIPAGSGLKSPGTVETTRPGGHWGYKQGTFIADLTRPARTVTAASTQDWVRLPGEELRRLTLRECQALQGFPDTWEFLGSIGAKFRQVGNAVPAIFGQVLGATIRDHWVDRRRKRSPVQHAASFPLPPSIMEAIQYTAREELRNGESRRVRVARGLGSESDNTRGQL